MTRVDLTFGSPDSIVVMRTIELPAPPVLGQVLRGYLGKGIGLQVINVDWVGGYYVADVIPRIQDIVPPDVLKPLVERDGWVAFVCDPFDDGEATMITPGEDDVMDTVECVPTRDLLAVRGVTVDSEG